MTGLSRDLNGCGYRQFLEHKIKLAEPAGFAVDAGEINPALKPHCRAIVPWALAGGRRAIFASFGLHKTSMQIEIMRLIGKHCGGRQLIVLPLGVRQEFTDEAAERFQGEHAVKMRFVQRADDLDGDGLYLTNYESIREGKLDPNLFNAASLDEAAVLRSFGSKTYQEFLPLFADVPFRFVATATPSPNRTKELIHYAGFLGVMDTGQALTRFFQRDSEKAGNLTLYPHKEDEFWLWVHSWAIFLQKPSDLGFDDDGYELPPVDIHWHEVPSDHSKAGVERDGQALLFRDSALGIVQAAAEKRDSLPARMDKLMALRAIDPAAHRIIWHDLEVEREAIAAAIPTSRAIYGSQKTDRNEQNAIDFKHGRFQELATKPEMSGVGCNFQKHCAWSVFLGIGFKFHDFIQAVHRTVRFGQSRRCRIDIIFSEAEREVRRILEAKWAEHDRMTERMREIIRRYGLDKLPLQDVLGRSIGVPRNEVRGERFWAVNEDCVEETSRMVEGSVDQIITSIPFSNHYEYTALYNDFGHTDDNAHFWRQMDYLTPQLLRILQPGRLACVHVKDRVLFGSVTGAGAPTISPFHAEAILHYRRHGFDYSGMITVITDVVRENNQTYRLGYSEMCKDGTKMGVGCPEYVLLLRKPQSDRSRGYADVPVVKRKEDYSLARWQLDAHSFWRSSGNRLLAPGEFAAAVRQLGMDQISSIMKSFSASEVYDHEYLVALGDALGDRLPKTFMALGPTSHHDDAWHDVRRMATLNGEQARRNVEFHLCPLQFDIVDRLIDRFSNPGDVIFDPFGGLMTVPYRALLRGRHGGACELNATYFKDGVHYLKAAEAKVSVPALFDLPPPEKLVDGDVAETVA
ncbi:MAG: DNA methyltransferase [Pseudolabrys sp.]